MSHGVTTPVLLPTPVLPSPSAAGWLNFGCYKQARDAAWSLQGGLQCSGWVGSHPWGAKCKSRWNPPRPNRKALGKGPPPSPHPRQHPRPTRAPHIGAGRKPPHQWAWYLLLSLRCTCHPRAFFIRVLNPNAWAIPAHQGVRPPWCVRASHRCQLACNAF